jgi:plasmid stability protein
MAKSLIVRNLDEALVHRLKLRAARHGRSAEAEHRAILQEALAADAAGSLKDVAARLRELTRGRRHTPAEELLREARDEH